MKKVLIISNKDKTWLIPAWFKVLSTSYDKLKFEKIILVPDKITNLNKTKTYGYYLSTFGLYNFIKLGLFFIYQAAFNFKIVKKLSKLISLEDIHSFDIKKISKDIKEIKPDIVFITCSYIIPNELLNIDKNILWVNKHASLLPKTKGLFPYIWNVILERKQGITFHEVTDKIDSGNILYQKEITNKGSMVSFYKEIYFSFEKYISLFYENMNTNKYIKNTDKDYYSLPNKNDLKEFRKKEGKVIQFRDFYEK